MKEYTKGDGNSVRYLLWYFETRPYRWSADLTMNYEQFFVSCGHDYLCPVCLYHYDRVENQFGSHDLTWYNGIVYNIWQRGVILFTYITHRISGAQPRMQPSDLMSAQRLSDSIIAPMPVTLSDLEDHFCCQKHFLRNHTNVTALRRCSQKCVFSFCFEIVC